VIDRGMLPNSEVNEPVYRVILSRYPQVHLFERVSGPQDWEVISAVESLTKTKVLDVEDIRAKGGGTHGAKIDSQQTARVMEAMRRSGSPSI
jgi:hypothetical protein